MLIQPITTYPGTRTTTAGEAWRQIRNWWIIPLRRRARPDRRPRARRSSTGPRDRSAATSRDTGRVIERFTYFERAAHWTNAIAFSVLAISGLVMAFGKFILLPIIGGAAVRLADLAAEDGAQLRRAAVRGLAGDHLPDLRAQQLAEPRRLRLAQARRRPARRRGSAVASLQRRREARLLGRRRPARRHRHRLRDSCSTRSFPGSTSTRPDMQTAHIVHAIAAMLIIAVFLGHIYIGTIGMRGSYRAMKTGYVDEGWAREHHRLWYDDIAAGKIPAQRTVPRGGTRAARSLIRRRNPMRHLRSSPSPLACLVARRRARQAAAALRRGQGQGRRGREQDGVERQGRRLPALPVDGPGRRRLSRARGRRGQAGVGARRRRRRARDPGPYVALQSTPAASKPLEASEAHSPPGMAT